MTSWARLAVIGGAGALAAVAFVATWSPGPERSGRPPSDVGRVELRDVLIGRDAQVHAGRLDGCNATSCRLDGRAYERSAIAFIGLGVETVVPPPFEDPSRDELRLRAGGVAHEPLAQIDGDAVFAGARRFERGAVAWIHLAPERGEPAPRAASEPPRKPGPSESPQPPSPPRGQGEDKPHGPVAGADMGPCGPATGAVKGSGVIWTGKARVRESLRYPSGGSLERDAEIEVKLREVCEFQAFDSANRLIATLITLDPSGSVTRESFKDYQPGGVCEGRGTHTQAIIATSMIWRRRAPGDTTGDFGFDVPSQPLYTLLIPGAGTVVAPCRGESRSGSLGGTMLQFSAGRTPGQSGELWDPELRNLEGGIMRGTYAKPLGPATHEVAWSICRAGVKCPPLPEFKTPPTAAAPAPASKGKDECGELAAERGLVDVIWQQRQAYARSMETEWNRLKQTHKEMLENREAYRKAIVFCAISDIAAETLESSSGWGGEFTEFVTKVLSGDLSVTVGAEPWKTLAERAWASFPRESTWAGNMRSHVGQCYSQLVSPDLKSAALRFVDRWEQVRQLMPALQEKINRVRSNDLRYWEQWQRFHQVCLETAKCKGIPATSCPTPPSEPRGPMPGAPR